MQKDHWAKFPSSWILRPTGEPDSDFGGGQLSYALSKITWKDVGSVGSASIIVLLGLAILLNQANRDNVSAAPGVVRATYTEIEHMTGLSRVLIARSNRLLVEVGAIRISRVKNANTYHLVGTETNMGGWCAIPQSRLTDESTYLKRIVHIRENIRRPSSLHTLKLYVLLLALRDRKSNLSRASYETIGKYTGLRRSEISTAWQMLVSAQLGYIPNLEEGVEGGFSYEQHYHNRYRLYGLGAVATKHPDREDKVNV